MATRKDLTREINNAKSRLKQLQERRTFGGEAREALEGAPIAHGATEFVAYLDKEIKKEEELIARLKSKREKLKR